MTRWLDGIKNKIPLYGAPKKLSSRDKHRLNGKGWGYSQQMAAKRKSVAVLISDKIDFKP